MDFVLTDEQKMFGESLNKFFQSEYAFADRQETIQAGNGFSPELWRSLADLGVLALPFDPAYGGFGGTAVDNYIAFEAMGRALAAEPALSTLVLAGTLLNQASNQAQKEELIPAIVAGELIVGVGFYEPQGRFNLNNCATTAVKSQGHYLISGTKSVVYAADTADKFVISARTTGDPLHEEGISLFFVDADAYGLTRKSYPTVDGFMASELYFDEVCVPTTSLTGEVDKGLPLIEEAVDAAIVASCAEAVGNMSALIERTLEHCKTREAFGQPISSFQVIQHRLVDMTVACEHAAAITMRAAKLFDSGENERSAAAAAAKVQVNKEAEFVGPNAVQLHGAMGMTEELDVGHYFKRLVVLGSSFGDTHYSVRRYMNKAGL